MVSGRSTLLQLTNFESIVRFIFQLDCETPLTAILLCDLLTPIQCFCCGALQNFRSDSLLLSPSAWKSPISCGALSRMKVVALVTSSTRNLTIVRFISHAGKLPPWSSRSSLHTEQAESSPGTAAKRKAPYQSMTGVRAGAALASYMGWGSERHETEASPFGLAIVT